MVWRLESAFSRKTTFLWAICVLIGLSTRSDQLGVTSIVRALGLKNKSYECLRQFFRSKAINLGRLTKLWKEVVEELLDKQLVRYNNRKVYLIDGIKVAKEGRRMAGVKWLFQSSQNSSKPSYIFGHSFQALHILASVSEQYVAVPLIMRIHEGLNDRRGSLVIRVLDFIYAIGIRNSYIVGDAYYWAGELSKELRSRGNHLISRLKSTAVAYEEPPKSKGRGRPKIYGKKRKLKNFFIKNGFTKIQLFLYGKTESIEYKERIFICKNHQCAVKYIFIKSSKGRCILASTDTELSAKEIIEIYSLRFKIEFSFKEFVHDFGGFTYRFWSKSIDRSRSKQVLKRNSRLEDAYHLYVQLAVIAQGTANILALKHSEEIWKVQSYWMRTIRPGVLPSAAVVRNTLKQELPIFLGLKKYSGNITKFIANRRRIDEYDDLAKAA